MRVTMTGLFLVALLGCAGSEPPEPVSAVIFPFDTLVVGLQDSGRAPVMVIGTSGRPLTGRAVLWTISDTSVAVVDPRGTVFGHQSGRTRIIATTEGRSDTASLVVHVLFASVSAGSNHTCAVSTAWMLYCWGGNERGQLGTGLAQDTALPLLVRGELRFQSVSSNKSSGYFRHTCALTRDGIGYCWGDGAAGQLGTGTASPSAYPAQLAGAVPFLRLLVVGNSHSCGLALEAGAAYCWGLNADGQLGTGGTQNRVVPTPVLGGLSFTTLALGQYHTCGLVSDGRAFCWGGNPNREYGVDTTGASLTPRLVSDTLRFSTIAAGDYHTCGLDPNGRAYCWGGNAEGQLGTGDTVSSVTPRAVASTMPFTTITAGIFHTCATTATETAYCWGFAWAGVLGFPGPGDLVVSTPTPSPSPVAYDNITGGNQHSCGRTVNGDIYCWGANNYGQLGTGSRIGGSNHVRVRAP